MLALTALPALLSQGCALTAGALDLGKPAPAAPREQACIEPGRALLRSSSIGGVLRVARRPGSTAPARLRLEIPVAVAARGNEVFIADAGTGRVLRFDRGTQSVTPFLDVPSLRPDTRLFVDRALSLYVVEPSERRVVQYDLDGREVQRFEDRVALPTPAAAVVDDGRSEILIADRTSARIVVFNRLGSIVRTIGAVLAGEVRFATIAAISSAGDSLYVLDALQRRVFALGLGGNLRYEFGAGELQAPMALASDSQGRVYVGEGDGTLKVFQGGEFLEAVGRPGDPDGLAFRTVSDLFASDGSLYVADSGRGTVEVLQVGVSCP